jgi:hypothetical protein
MCIRVPRVRVERVYARVRAAQAGPSVLPLNADLLDPLSAQVRRIDRR